MGFFRSSEARPKSKSRFSFRRHSDDLVDDKPVPVPPVSARKPLASSSSSSTANLRGTIISSASTSTSSSLTSPSALQRAAHESDKLKRASDSLVSTDTDDSDAMRAPSESSELPTTPRESLDDGASTRSGRHSLVGFRQLQCSMSYKNRMAQGATGEELLLRASASTGGRRSETGSLRSSRVSRGSGTFLHSRESTGLAHIDELAIDASSSSSSSSSSPASASSSSAASSPEKSTDKSTPTPALPVPVPASTASERRRSSTHEQHERPSTMLGGRPSELRMTEANVAALQTRRAFQQMVLAMDDDEDSDEDSDSEGYGSYPRAKASTSFSGAGVVQLGADEYRKFQFRLRQLEDLCQEQARKQANMEETIETEVTQRTKKVIEAMEKKIAMYKQAKDLEVEREIQRRSEGRFSTVRESSFLGLSSQLPPQYPTLGSSPGADRAKPLDKILHPRRTRRRMEMLREREEQQKREMEQFREFIRTTEMSVKHATGRDVVNSFLHDTQRAVSEVNGSDTARESIKALRDPHITEDLLSASQNELIEMICVLRKHVSVQEAHLEEAKRLISAAIEAREEAEETAREAVELTMELDNRLERASQEMIVMKDELRRSSDFSMRSSYLMSSMGADRNSQFSASYHGASSQSKSVGTGSYPG